MGMMEIYNRMPPVVQNAMLSAYGFNLCRTRYNKSFFKAVTEAEQRKKLSAVDTCLLLENKINDLINHVYSHVPFYRNYMKEKGIKPESIRTLDDLTIFPLIDKKFVKEHYSEFISDNAEKTIDYYTGGTTGSSFIVKTTQEEIIYNFAIYEAVCKHEFGIKWGDSSAVFLGKRIVPLTKAKSPFWRKSFPIKQELFSIYHMNDNTIPLYIEELRKQEPRFLTGYASPVYKLAEYIERNDLDRLSIKAVFLSSETLTDTQKTTIEKAFNCLVCNGYSQAEGVAFISSTKDGLLRVAPDYGAVEFIPTEQPGFYEIVGTSLFNFTMPLIRYRTHDLAYIRDFNTDEKGIYPFIDAIIGREDGVIHTPDSRVISAAALSLVFKNYPQISQVKIIQDSILHANVIVECTYNSNDADFIRFTNEMSELFGHDFVLEYTIVDEIPKESNGKTRMIISKIQL